MNSYKDISTALSAIGLIKLIHYHQTIDKNSPNILVTKQTIKAIYANAPNKRGIALTIDLLIQEGALKRISGNDIDDDDFCCELVNYKKLDEIAKNLRDIRDAKY